MARQSRSAEPRMSWSRRIMTQKTISSGSRFNPETSSVHWSSSPPRRDKPKRRQRKRLAGTSGPASVRRLIFGGLSCCWAIAIDVIRKPSNTVYRLVLVATGSGTRYSVSKITGIKAVPLSRIRVQQKKKTFHFWRKKTSMPYGGLLSNTFSFRGER